MDAKTLQNIVNKLRSRNDTIITSTERDNKSSSPMIPTISTEHPTIPSIPIVSSAINHHHHSPPIAPSEGNGDNNGSSSSSSYSQEVRYNTVQKGSASEVR